MNSADNKEAGSSLSRYQKVTQENPYEIVADQNVFCPCYHLVDCIRSGPSESSHEAGEAVSTIPAKGATGIHKHASYEAASLRKTD